MISWRNLADLFVSLSLSAGMLWYAHQGLEAEQALGEHRSLTVMGLYAILGLVGLLVAPTIRDRILPAANAAVILIRTGRRGGDVAVVVPPETKGL